MNMGKCIYIFKIKTCNCIKTNLIKNHTMKTYGGMTSVLYGGEWSASCPDHFIPKERSPGTNWIGGWVGPRADLGAVENRKDLASTRNRIPAVQPYPITVPTESSQLLD
jgi:hypothetical protein